MNDNEVIHPQHYRQGGIEPLEFIQSQGLSFIAGNVVKYLTRHRHVGDVNDLKKAQRYLDILVQEESEPAFRPSEVGLHYRDDPSHADTDDPRGPVPRVGEPCRGCYEPVEEPSATTLLEDRARISNPMGGSAVDFAFGKDTEIEGKTFVVWIATNDLQHVAEAAQEVRVFVVEKSSALFIDDGQWYRSTGDKGAFVGTYGAALDYPSPGDKRHVTTFTIPVSS